MDVLEVTLIAAAAGQRAEGGDSRLAQSMNRENVDVSKTASLVSSLQRMGHMDTANSSSPAKRRISFERLLALAIVAFIAFEFVNWVKLLKVLGMPITSTSATPEQFEAEVQRRLRDRAIEREVDRRDIEQRRQERLRGLPIIPH